jgi:hypothetical protein
MDKTKVLSIVEEIQSLECGDLEVLANRILLLEQLMKISEGKDDELRSILDSLLAEQKITTHTREWLEDAFSLR